MSDLSLEINSWIVAHQAVVVAVGVPCLTTLVAGIVSWVTTRANLAAQKKSRELQKQIRLFEAREKKIGELREVFSQLEAIYSYMQLDMKQGLSSGKIDEVTREQVIQFVSRLTEIMPKVQLLVPQSDPDYRALSSAMRRGLKPRLGAATEPEVPLLEPFVAVAGRVLRRLEEQSNASLEE